MENQSPDQVADFLPLTPTNCRRFVEAFSSPIAAQATRFRLPADLVQDVVQETLLRALRGLGSFRGDSKLSTWVYRIAYRECVRMREKHLRHQGGVRALDPAQEPEGHGEEAVSVAGREDEVARLRRLMEGLPETQRLAMGYHYLEDMSVAEIATAMDAAPNTVKSWLKRGRDNLRARLGEEQA